MPKSKLKSDINSHLLQVAVRYLSYRPRFTSEIRRRLSEEFRKLSLDENPLIIDSVIEKLSRDRFLNDAELIIDYVNQQINRGRGVRAIEAKLRYLGLEASLINQTLSKLVSDSDQREQAQKLLLRRYPSGLADFSEKAKAARFLAGRGFSSQIIRDLIDEWS